MRLVFFLAWGVRVRLTRLGSQEISATDFGKVCGRNPSPILGSVSPTSVKSATDFGKKTGSFFGKDWLGLRERLARFEGKIGSIWGKLDWLGRKLKSHCFERYACLGLEFLRF